MTGQPARLSTAAALSMMLVGKTHLLQRHANMQLADYDVPAGITLHRIWAMVQLVYRQRAGLDVRMSDFAGVLGISTRTVTTVVDVLEAQGLLERCDDPGDRRVTLLQVTTRALDLMPEFERVIHDAGEQMCAALPEADRVELLRLLGNLRGEPATAGAG